MADVGHSGLLLFAVGRTRVKYNIPNSYNYDCIFANQVSILTEMQLGAYIESFLAINVDSQTHTILNVDIATDLYVHIAYCPGTVSVQYKQQVQCDIHTTITDNDPSCESLVSH